LVSLIQLPAPHSKGRSPHNTDQSSQITSAAANTSPRSAGCFGFWVVTVVLKDKDT
jgi:hypothetical protein